MAFIGETPLQVRQALAGPVPAALQGTVRGVLDARAVHAAAAKAAIARARSTVAQLRARAMCGLLDSFDVGVAEALHAAASIKPTAQTKPGSRDGPTAQSAVAVRMAGQRLVRDVQRLRSALPVFSVRPAFTQAVAGSACVVVVGPAGVGKSTQLPQYLAEMMLAGTLRGRRIICTQRHTIAAVAMATRVAGEWAAGDASEQRVGCAVGCRAGGTAVAGPTCVVEYCTESALVAALVATRSPGAACGLGLADVAAIVLDDAHERTAQFDVLLGAVRCAQAATPGLAPRLVVVTAECDATPLAAALGACPVVEVAGPPSARVEYHPDPNNADCVRRAVALAVAIHRDATAVGNVLVFVPGADDAELAVTTFVQATQQDRPVQCLALHDRQAPDEQHRVLTVRAPGVRLVVFATSIAETGVAVPHVRHVIDCGMTAVKTFDARRGVTVCEILPVSRCATTQRKGRAGDGGTCHRMYSLNDRLAMRPTRRPDVLACSMGAALATLCALGFDAATFPWLTAPDAANTAAAASDLVLLGAMDAAGCITDVGRIAAALQVDPAVARLLHSAYQRNAGTAGALLAGALSVADGILCPAPAAAGPDAVAARGTLADGGGDAVVLLRSCEHFAGILDGRVDAGLTDLPAAPPAASVSAASAADDDEMREMIELVTPAASVEACAALGDLANAAGDVDDDDDDDGEVVVCTAGLDDADEGRVAAQGATVRPARDGTAPGPDVGGDVGDACAGVDGVTTVRDRATASGAADVAAEHGVCAAVGGRVAGDGDAEDDARARAGDARRDAAHAWCTAHALGGSSVGAAVAAARDFAAVLHGLRPWTGSQDAALSGSDVQRIVAHAFVLNTAIVSGRPRDHEYVVLHSGRAVVAVPHAASTVVAADHAGSRLVCAEVLDVGRVVLAVCTPVSDAWVAEDSPAFAAMIAAHQASLPVAVRVKDVSVALARALLGRRPEDKAAVEAAIGTELTHDAVRQELVGWCAPAVRAAVQQRLQDAVENACAMAAEETCEESLPDGPDMRAVYGKGGTVVQLLFGREFVSVDISNLPRTATDKALRALGETVGSVRAAHVMWGGVGRVTFTSPDDAAAALRRLDGVDMDGAVLRARECIAEPDAGPRDGVSLLPRERVVSMMWSITQSKGAAVVSYRTAAEANAAYRAVRQTKGHLHTMGSFLLGQEPMHPDCPPLNAAKTEFVTTAVRPDGKPFTKFNISLSHVPLRVDEEELTAMLRNIPGVPLPAAVRVRRDRVGDGWTLNRSCAEMMRYVAFPDALSSVAPFVRHGRDRAGMVLRYHDGTDAAVFAVNVPAPVICGQALRSTVEYQRCVLLPPVMWNVFYKDIMGLCRGPQGVCVHMFAHDPSASEGSGGRGCARVSLQFVSEKENVLDNFIALLVRVMAFTDYVAPSAAETALLLSQANRQITDAGRTNGTYARALHAADVRHSSCTVTAVASSCINVSPSVASAAHVRSRAAAEPYTRTSLLWRSTSTLAQLQRTIAGIVALSVRGRRITVRGVPDAVQQLRAQLGTAVVDVGPVVAAVTTSAGVEREASEGSDCLLCGGPLEKPVLLTRCRHAFCHECLANEFVSAHNHVEVRLPLTCWAPGCEQPYGWGDIVALTSPAALAFLKATAVQRYLKEHPELHRCVNAACTQIIDFSSIPDPGADEARRGGQTYTCAGCGGSYCVRCSLPDAPAEAHAGQTCAAFTQFRTLGVDVHMRQIGDQLNLRCPSCKTVFLDFVGCCAVTCSCGMQFCAFCLEACAKDVHPHVLKCPLNTGGSYFCSMDELSKVHAAQRRRVVADYLRPLAPDVVTAVLEQCAVMLRNVGIDPATIMVA